MEKLLHQVEDATKRCKDVSDQDCDRPLVEKFELLSKTDIFPVQVVNILPLDESFHLAFVEITALVVAADTQKLE